jgi:hypothetical protein
MQILLQHAAAGDVAFALLSLPAPTSEQGTNGQVWVCLKVSLHCAHQGLLGAGSGLLQASNQHVLLTVCSALPEAGDCQGMVALALPGVWPGDGSLSLVGSSPSPCCWLWCLHADGH